MTLVIENLTKQYGATKALDSVSLEVKAGQVHALLGHNGAGKSTLIKCLGGGVSPTSGKITLDGELITEFSPTKSISSGIAVIYQHLSLIDALSVTDNLFLGQEISKAAGVIDKSKQRQIAVEALARVGSIAKPEDIVGRLSMGQRQLVEIAKALLRDAKLLILDEPSAALSPVESRRLAEVVRTLQKQGLAIIYVTHLLNDVMALADHTTILRNGQVVWSKPMQGLTKNELVSAISDETNHRFVQATQFNRNAEPAYEIENFIGCGVGPISLKVRPGEVVGLYGLIGAGRSRLLEMMFGRLPHESGIVRIDGKSVTVSNPTQALANNIALVPADRVKQGLFGSLSAHDNATFRFMSTSKKGLFRNLKLEDKMFQEIAQKMSLRPNRPELEASRFSGGNAQKILIGRWVYQDSGVKVLLLDDPTQGVDVAARAEIYRVVRSLVEERNIAVVFASNEPEEILALAHRCVILRDGKFIQDFEITDTDEEKLLGLIHSQG